MPSTNNYVMVFGDTKLKETSQVRFIYSNVIYWKGEVIGKTTAIFAPNYPKIEKAYLDSGRKIMRITEDGSYVFLNDFENVLKAAAVETTPADPTPDVAEVSVEDKPTESPEPIADQAQVKDEDADKEQAAPSEQTAPSNVSNKNWRELSAKDKKELAQKFTDTVVSNKAEAEEILEKAEKEGKL